MKKILIILLLVIVLSQLATAQNEGLKYYVDATQAISSGDIEKAGELYKLASENLDGELKERAVMMHNLLDKMQYDATKPKLINKEGWFFIGETQWKRGGIFYHLYYDTKGNNIIHARFSGPADIKNFLDDIGAYEKFEKAKVTKSSKGYVLIQKQEDFVTDIRIWDCDEPETSTNILTSTFSGEDYSEKFFQELDGCPGESVFPWAWILGIIAILIILAGIILIYKKSNKKKNLKSFNKK